MMKPSTELQDIISGSSFEVQSGIYVYGKVKTLPKNQNHFLVSRDTDEITVVTEKAHLPDLDLIERNKDDYSLIALLVSIPFYSVGFLAAISAAMAEKGLNILIVSTYSKDYVLVRTDLLETAKEALHMVGLQEKK
jgi:hypothetical protein